MARATRKCAAHKAVGGPSGPTLSSQIAAT
ncbi:DUF6053 domain-containing protein [Lysobacter enzymogenes]